MQVVKVPDRIILLVNSLQQNDPEPVNWICYVFLEVHIIIILNTNSMEMHAMLLKGITLQEGWNLIGGTGDIVILLVVNYVLHA